MFPCHSSAHTSPHSLPPSLPSHPPQVLNTQRDKVYGERRRALEASDLARLMEEYAEKTVDDILEVREQQQQ